MEPTTRSALGKRVRSCLYFHVTALERFDIELHKIVRHAAIQAGLDVETAFNVVKVDQEKNVISLLYYDRFFYDLFPVLKRSAIVDLASGRTKHRHYDSSSNPPILHRKELLLPADHPQVPSFQALTRQLEAAGLFRDSRRIGLAREWQERFQSA